MSTDDRKRILQRIQKCLSLTNSNEPHEAAAALRQAQKLMAAHNISEDDINRIDVESDLVVTTESWKKTLPLYLSHLVSLVERAFGVKGVFEPGAVNGKLKMNIRYFGPQGRAQLAAYTHKVIWRSLQHAWKKYSATNPWVNDQKGARTGFWVGWILAVRKTVEAFGGQVEEEKPRADGSGTELVPTSFGKEMTKIQTVMEQHYGSLTESKANAIKQYASTREAGAEAAKDFQLHRPMNGAQQRALGNN